MARIRIKYEAIDPYYSDQVQTFIGETIESCDEQRYEFERYLGRNHPHGFMAIYSPIVIEEKV